MTGTKNSTEAIVKILKSGGVGVLATDTLYGLVARAEEPATVERLYALKGRRPDKPLIILIARVADIKRFGVELDATMLNQIQAYWPGPVSIILPCPDEAWAYLHRGTRSLAFRMPAKLSLRRLIACTGPLVAPSANPQGLEPADSIACAKGYFGTDADFYRRGRVTNQPSKLIRIYNGGVETLRG